MSNYLRLMLFVSVALFRSLRRLAAEILVLRHQVLVLKCKHRGRIKLNGLDRVMLTWLSRAVPSVRSAILIVQPETLLRWHVDVSAPFGAGSLVPRWGGRALVRGAAT